MAKRLTVPAAMAILMILSVMALGFATLVGEVHGAPAEVGDTALDTVDIDTAARLRCRAVDPGSTLVTCGSCTGGTTYDLKVRGPAGTTGSAECGGGGLLGCMVKVDDMTCDDTATSFGGGDFTCLLTTGDTSRATATCTEDRD